jgi:outer membrane protein assembly factor BamE (lipoprotein component of BamABCDE complex)
MKRYGVVCILFCLGTMGWAENATISTRPGNWRSPMAWRQLAKKMTESQIVALLGQPREKETTEQFDVWYYQDAPKRENGQIVWRPKTGLVRFRQVPIDGQQVFLLLDWKLPLWREVAAMPMEVNEPTAAPVEPIQPAEPVEKPAVKVEVNQPVIQAPTPAQPEPEPDTSLQGRVGSAINWFKTVPRKWLWIGGGVLLFILYGIFKPDPRYKPRPPKKPDIER